MDIADLEGTVSLAFRACGADDYDPPKLPEIIRGLGLSLQSFRGLRTPACLTKINGRDVIWLKPQLGRAASRFSVAHEVGEFLLKKEGYSELDIEDCANYLAAALLAPRMSFRRVLGRGASIEELAENFGVSRTLAAIRIGEVTGAPCAVVCRSYTFFRGEEFEWGGCVKKLGGVDIGERRRKLVRF